MKKVTLASLIISTIFSLSTYANVSSYLSLEDNACKTIESNDEIGYAISSCGTVGNKNIEIIVGDGRSYLQLTEAGKNEVIVTPEFGSYLSGKAVELRKRTEAQQPFALIVRFSGMNVETNKVESYLLVYSLEKQKRLGVIKVNSKANEKARLLADQDK